MDAGKERFRGLRITVVGFAREGKALTRFLLDAGARVTVTDLKRREELLPDVAEFEGSTVRFVLGENPLWLLDETDVLFVSPGVPLEVPIVAEARRRGIPVSGEARLFCELCPTPYLVGITGSSGKTTTTTLVGEMLKAAGFVTWVGGNIGVPLLPAVEEMHPDHRVAMELSSFQLDLFAPEFGYPPGRGLSPPIAAVLNVTPNHLDRHPSMEDYIRAKEHIILHQRPDDVAVLGYDNPVSRGMAAKAPGRVLFFSLEKPLDEGAFLRGGDLLLRLDGREHVICRASQVRLRGMHNIANVLAAALLARLAGAPPEAITHVATTFTGVEHRLEFVRELGGVRYYNDSIATSPERVVAALKSFDEPIVLLAGGRDKHLPWEEMADLTVRKVRHLVLFGEAVPIIERAVREAMRRARADSPAITVCHTLEEAVDAAARVARPGDVVLLSPGGTSFDAFRDYAHRGRRFKELVMALEEPLPGSDGGEG